MLTSPHSQSRGDQTDHYFPLDLKENSEFLNHVEDKNSPGVKCPKKPNNSLELLQVKSRKQLGCWAWWPYLLLRQRTVRSCTHKGPLTRIWVQDPPKAAHEDVGITHPGKTGFKVMMTFFYNTFLQTWWLNLGLPSSGRQSHDTWSKGGSIPGKGDSGSIKAKEYTAREFCVKQRL